MARLFADILDKQSESPKKVAPKPTGGKRLFADILGEESTDLKPATKPTTKPTSSRKGGLFADILNEEPKETALERAKNLFGGAVKAGLAGAEAASPIGIGKAALRGFEAIKRKEAEAFPMRQAVEEAIPEALRPAREMLASAEATPRGPLGTAALTAAETGLQAGEFILRQVPVTPTEVTEFVTFVKGANLAAGAIAETFPRVAAALVSPVQVPVKAQTAFNTFVFKVKRAMGVPQETGLTVVDLRKAVDEGRVSVADAARMDKKIFQEELAKRNVGEGMAKPDLKPPRPKPVDVPPEVTRNPIAAPEVIAKPPAPIKALLPTPEAEVAAGMISTAPAEPVSPFTVPGTEIGTRTGFAQIKRMMEAGEIEMDPQAKEFLGQMDAFWKFHPDAETGIIQEDGSIAPKLPGEFVEPAISMVPEPGEAESINSMAQGGEGAIHDLTADDFKRRFPNAPEGAHEGMIRNAVASGKIVNPEAIKSYPDLEFELSKPEVQARTETPLLDFVRKNGGIDAKKSKEFRGELENASRMNILRKKGGKSISELAEIAASEGIIPEYDENKFIDALDKEARTRSMGVSFVGEGDPKPAFYHKLQLIVEQKLPNKATIGQVEALLRDWSGDERKWSGIDEFLKGKDKISKPELLEFLRANQLEIKEVEKGRRSSIQTEALLIDRKKIYDRFDNNEISRIERDRLLEKADDKYTEAKGGLPKFDQYVLPGGENYREMLLTLPVKGGLSPKQEARLDELNRMIDASARGEQALTQSELTEQNSLSQLKFAVLSKQAFRSGHFDEPNILAHVRFNDRVDADGKKVLFIEEIQSDWHQKGRRQGYASDKPTYEKLPDRYQIVSVKEKEKPGDTGNVIRYRVVDSQDHLANGLPRPITAWHYSRESAENEAINILNDQARGTTASPVPDAPFKKTWHEFALKRMVRYAAENGYDKIAWTTGEQQAERYDLSKQVDSISYTKNPEGDYSVFATGKGPGHRIEIGTHPAARLPDVVGKEVADKIITGQGERDDVRFGQNIIEGKTLSGLDLKVGGEGMKGFYDKIVPSFLNKFGKRFGAEVEESQFKVPGRPKVPDVIRGDSGRYQVDLGDGTFWGSFASRAEAIDAYRAENYGGFKSHALEITDDLKRAALEEGFPLFQVNESKIAFGSVKSKAVISSVAQNIRQIEFDFNSENMASSGLADKLQKNGFVDYRGTKVENARQAAEVAAAFRDPKIEHFQVLFVRKGVLVAHQVISSGLPDGAVIPARFKYQIKSAMRRLGADEIYVAHNHPSGDPKPSSADIVSSKRFAMQIDGYKGHVITDDKKFSFIDDYGDSQLLDFEKPKPAFHKRAEEGIEIASPSQAMAAAGKDFIKGKQVQVLFMDARLKLISVDTLNSMANVQEYMRQGKARYGAARMLLIAGSKWSPKFPGQFPHGLSDVIAHKKNSYSSMQADDPGRLASITEPDPVGKMLEEGRGFYRVQEAGPEYGPDEFRAIVSMAGIKPGSELTLKRSIHDPSAKGGRIPAGTMVKVVDIDQDGSLILIQTPETLSLTGAKGMYTTARIQDFTEIQIAEPPQPPQGRAVKQQIQAATGLATQQGPVQQVSEMELLRAKLASMEKGAKIGEREGARRMRGMMLERFRIERTYGQGIKSAVIEYIEKNIPISERGRFLNMVKSAKTLQNLAKAFARVDAKAAELYKKDLVKEIKKTAEKALDSGRVAVEFKRRIHELMSQFELQGRTQATISRLKATETFMQAREAAGEDVFMPRQILEKLAILNRRPINRINELDLEILLGDIQELVAGGTKLRENRQALYELRRENIKAQVVEGVKRIESHELMRHKPGEQLDFGQKLGNAVSRVANKLQEFDLAILPMDVVFDMLDGSPGYNGPLFINFKRRMDGSWGRFYDRWTDARNPVKDLIAKYKMTSANMERIGVHADKLQPGGRDRLKAGHGLTDADIDSVVLTVQEKEIYDLMRKTFDESLPAIKDKMAFLYNADVGEVQNYFPYIPDFEASEGLPVEHRILDAYTGQPVRTKTVEQGFTKARVEKAKSPTLIDAWERFDRHMQHVSYLLEAQENVKMLFEVANSPEFGEASGTLGQSMVLDWLDLNARMGGVDGAKKIRILDLLRNNVGAATLGLRLSSILIQPTAMLEGAGYIGGSYVLRGLENLINKDFRKFLFDNLPELRSRVGDDPAFVEKSLFPELQRKAFGPLQAADRISAAAVAGGAYLKALDAAWEALDLANPVPEALAYANLILQRSQASPIAKDLGLALSRGNVIGNRSIAKAIFQFQTFVLNRWSNLRYDVPRLLRTGKKEEAAQLAGYIMLATIAETGIRRGLNGAIAAALAGLGLAVYESEDRDSFVKDTLYNMLDVAPIVGSIIRSGTYGSYPVPAFNTLFNLGKTPVELARARNTIEEVRATTRIIDTLAALTGIPGVQQVNQIVRAAIRTHTLPFPYARELMKLRDKNKRGELNEGEKRRFGDMRRADSAMRRYRTRFKSAMQSGNSKLTRDSANQALEEMRKYKR